ncbi:MAG: hypothetical protein H6713_30545 [Myxococcales bacterium]|nr:hypothetical protein [Myxococcales bacterium]
MTELRFVGAAGLPAPAHNRDAAARALTLMRRWDDRAHARLFTAALGPARIRTFLAGVRQAFGDCSLGDPQQVLPGGVVYALQCERGEARMRVSLTDDAPPRIGGFEITRAPGTGPCG